MIPHLLKLFSIIFYIYVVKCPEILSKEGKEEEPPKEEPPNDNPNKEPPKREELPMELPMYYTVY